MKKLVDELNLASYKALYKSMEYDHSYPNINLVRLEKWFLKGPGTVLDHGCGYGENLIFLTTRGYQVTGVEICPELIEYLRLKCKIRKVPPTLFELKLIEKGQKRLPFEDETFDYVVSMGVLEMFGDKEAAAFCVKELSRCLKTAGKMIVSTLASENSFAIEGERLGDERYYFKGKEKYKEVALEYNLYIPNSAESLGSIFPPECRVEEVGSWDNDYCGIKGKHYVALITKIKKW